MCLRPASVGDLHNVGQRIGQPAVLEAKSTNHGAASITIAEMVRKCIPLPRPFHPHEVTRGQSLANATHKQLITDGNCAASHVGCNHVNLPNYAIQCHSRERRLMGGGWTPRHVRPCANQHRNAIGGGSSCCSARCVGSRRIYVFLHLIAGTAADAFKDVPDC